MCQSLLISFTPACIFIITWQKNLIMQCAYSQPELLNPKITHAVIVVFVGSRLFLMQIMMHCDVAVLNLSVQMRHGAVREPLARLLLISRFLLSPGMLSSDVLSAYIKIKRTSL